MRESNITEPRLCFQLWHSKIPAFFEAMAVIHTGIDSASLRLNLSQSIARSLLRWSSMPLVFQEACVPIANPSFHFCSMATNALSADSLCPPEGRFLSDALEAEVTGWCTPGKVAKLLGTARVLMSYISALRQRSFGLDLWSSRSMCEVLAWGLSVQEPRSFVSASKVVSPTYYCRSPRVNSGPPQSGAVNQLNRYANIRTIRHAKRLLYRRRAAPSCVVIGGAMVLWRGGLECAKTMKKFTGASRQLAAAEHLQSSRHYVPAAV
ncbi:uncharacterized protein EI97DRAFT_445098 [Westerdykella ornata]|uniref:Uncharacterized protein n=1 Tax=Westerdykella ornata TaxID=318751 RepID=A0A6A6J9V6_WESOR|nr:uncharacterized protein EI97DRAFT_445098 [Westerdykella ornata]KAF2273172.1 hypothetical protein EI97DRAFT_445098 [Westerdykella ornata]